MLRVDCGGLFGVADGCCLLCVGFCMWVAVRCLLFVVVWWLLWVVVCCLLFVVCLVFIDCCLDVLFCVLAAIRHLSAGVVRLVFAVWWLLPAAGCCCLLGVCRLLMFVARWSLLFVWWLLIVVVC